ncbi:uncharacterized protein LOC126753246 [Bactrocera neohumeralis]|uniref:uncharacterized protein LOC126753246 n=1 Tax=Bactrocera neohumeralis TaxID=98809 RepID=UPI002165C083|nr:uncharacterized protein LOC126753246 [Bactrocera neohumeralis]
MFVTSRLLAKICALVFALYIIICEGGQEDAWNCLEPRCCSIDFSKMVVTVDFLLYACGEKVDNEWTYSLFLDTGEEMDYIAYHPYQALDETQYCGEICEKILVCIKSHAFKVSGDMGGSAEWCFQGNVDVNNDTIYKEENICLTFHEDVVDIPSNVVTFLSSSNIW